MSKVLVFHDGTSASFTDESVVTDLVTVVSSFAEIDALRAAFTAENLVGATFDGEEVTNLVPVGTNASADLDGNVTVHFINRYKTDVELLQESQEEQNAAIDFLMFGE